VGNQICVSWAYGSLHTLGYVVLLKRISSSSLDAAQAISVGIKVPLDKPVGEIPAPLQEGGKDASCNLLFCVTSFE